MINPFSLRNLRNSNLKMLQCLAERQVFAAKFWRELYEACEGEALERLKLEPDRHDVEFSIPDLSPQEAGIVRNELAYLVARLEDSPDNALVAFLSAAGLVLSAQLEAAAAAN